MFSGVRFFSHLDAVILRGFSNDDLGIPSRECYAEGKSPRSQNMMSALTCLWESMIMWLGDRHEAEGAHVGKLLFERAVGADEDAVEAGAEGEAAGGLLFEGVVAAGVGHFAAGAAAFGFDDVEVARLPALQSVERECGVGLLRHVEHMRHFHLHPERSFERADSRAEKRVTGALGELAFIHPRHRAGLQLKHPVRSCAAPGTTSVP